MYSDRAMIFACPAFLKKNVPRDLSLRDRFNYRQAVSKNPDRYFNIILIFGDPVHTLFSKKRMRFQRSGFPDTF